MRTHIRVGVQHSLDDERQYHRQRHRFIVYIVLYVVHQGCHGVVGTVTTDGTRKVQLFVQVVLFDEAVGSHRHGTALRIAAYDSSPVFTEFHM